MTRPIAYDATHLVSRLNCCATTGIDRVDLAYARHLVDSPRLACGVHYGIRNPHIFSRERVARLAQRVAQETDDGARSPDDWAKLRAWLLGTPRADSPDAPRPEKKSDARDLLRKIELRLAHDAPRAIPDSAIYLNVAQHGLEYPRLFDWLGRRPDVRAAFFVHDFLPLDYPEYFRRGYEARFRRRTETILRHASAIIVSSHAVAERVESEFVARGKRSIPIHVQPLASPLDWPAQIAIDRELADSCYFVVVSTLEPRKNHLMLLNVWRALASAVGEKPKLVLVGNPGWENEQIVDMLQRSAAIRPYVRWVAGLSAGALRKLVANARALLMPSFAEGYGLPIVEALSLGAPAIVSDIPVFREIAQGRAIFLSPIDGAGWRDAIGELSAADSSRRQEAVRDTRGFAPPSWDGYFAKVEEFLATL